MGYFTATAALSQIEQRQLTATQLLHLCLERIDQRETAVRAWEFLAPEAALRQATSWDKQFSNGYQASTAMPKLCGIPVAVKDIFATVDMPTAWGTPVYAGRYGSENAAIVSRLQAAGAIILGKTVTTELATAASGRTRNPHNLAHTPGGSSSGSAAAVADGMVPVAIGSQTMGSVLRPAAYCGVFGFKPSFGVISREGMMPVCDDLDHVGLFARCLEDIEWIFDVLAVDGEENSCRQYQETEVSGDGESGLRLAWVRTPYWRQVESPAQSRLQQAVNALNQANIPVETVALPSVCDDYWETVQALCAYGLNANHGQLLETHRQACSPQLKDWLHRGRDISLSAYQQALQRGAHYREAVAAILGQYNAILTPVTSGPAPYGLATTGSPIFCGLWTLCGNPALSLPIGKTKAGLPLGIQLVGKLHDDRRFLQLAKQCWQVLKALEET